MGKKKKNSKVRDYRHDEKRKNNPPIGMVNYVLALFALHYALCSMRHACYSTGVRPFLKQVSHKAPLTHKEGGAFLFCLPHEAGP